MRRALVAMSMVCVALVAGCGGGDEEPAVTTEPAATEEAAPRSAGAEDGVQVTMKDFKFEPADVTVEAGETVTWVNEDTVQHDAVAQGGMGPKSELFNKGESYSWKAEGSGEISYVCTVHPGMEGKITVR